MEPISRAIYKTLMSAGIERGRLAGREAHGIGAGVPRRDKTHPLTAQAQGDHASRSGMGKGAEAEAPASQQQAMEVARFGRNGSSIRLVHTNRALDDMPKRGLTHPQSEQHRPLLGVSPRLRMIDGGRP